VAIPKKKKRIKSPCCPPFLWWKTVIPEFDPAPCGRATPLPLRARPEPVTPVESDKEK